jgi:hypothetical protein
VGRRILCPAPSHVLARQSSALTSESGIRVVTLHHDAADCTGGPRATHYPAIVVGRLPVIRRWVFLNTIPRNAPRAHPHGGLASVTCQQLSAKRQLHQRSTRSLAPTTSYKHEPRLRPVRLKRRITHRVSKARHAGFRSLGARSWLIFQAP